MNINDIILVAIIISSITVLVAYGIPYYFSKAFANLRSYKEPQEAKESLNSLFLIFFGILIICCLIYWNKQKDSGILQNQANTSFQPEVSSNNQQAKQSQNGSKTQQIQTEKQSSPENILANKIVENIYTWYEEGSSASLTFRPDGNSSVGTMVLTGSIHTLEFRFEGDRNALDAITNPKQICSFTYAYNISGNYIHATFVNSSCNYQAKDRTFTFYESDNTICAYTSQGEMVFKP